jgi:hypothetical protein
MPQRQSEKRSLSLAHIRLWQLRFQVLRIVMYLTAVSRRTTRYSLTLLNTRAPSEQIIIEEINFGKRCLNAARFDDAEVAGTLRLP